MYSQITNSIPHWVVVIMWLSVWPAAHHETVITVIFFSVAALADGYWRSETARRGSERNWYS